MERTDPVFTLPPYRVDMLIAAEQAREKPQWWLTDENVQGYWGETLGGHGVKVGIIDTGVDERHAKSGELKISKAKDFTHSRYGPVDRNGHGTHVAGIVAARANSIGVLGLAPECELYIAKGLGDSGSGSSQGIARAIEWLVGDCKVDIINMSLGSPQASGQIKEAVDYAVRRGVLIVAAAGNGGRENNVGYPAAFDNVFAVGAVDRQKRLARFSDRGHQVQGVGFGVEMVSLYLNGQLAALSGTSMATPWLVGMLANRLSAEIAADWPETVIGDEMLRDLDMLCRETFDDLGTAGRDPEYGHGFPNAAKLFTFGLEEDEPAEPEPPEPPKIEHALHVSGEQMDGKPFVALAKSVAIQRVEYAPEGEMRVTRK